jgi:hypothetical protein
MLFRWRWYEKAYTARTRAIMERMTTDTNMNLRASGALAWGGLVVSKEVMVGEISVRSTVGEEAKPGPRCMCMASVVADRVVDELGDCEEAAAIIANTSATGGKTISVATAGCASSMIPFPVFELKSVES